MKEKRWVSVNISIKLGDYFEVENDYFLLLQSSFEVRNAIKKFNSNPLKDKIRTSIFWDIDLKKMDWDYNKRFIIQRVLERGNKDEIGALINVYSLPIIKKEIQKIGNSFHPDYDKNVNEHILKGH